MSSEQATREQVFQTFFKSVPRQDLPEFLQYLTSQYSYWKKERNRLAYQFRQKYKRKVKILQELQPTAVEKKSNNAQATTSQPVKQKELEKSEQSRPEVISKKIPESQINSAISDTPISAASKAAPIVSSRENFKISPPSVDSLNPRKLRRVSSRIPTPGPQRNPNPSAFLNLPSIQQHIRSKLQNKSASPLGRFLLIACIEKIPAWDELDRRKQQELVNTFWDNWKRLATQSGASIPSTTARQIMESLSDSRTIPDSVRKMVNPSSDPT